MSYTCLKNWFKKKILTIQVAFNILIITKTWFLITSSSSLLFLKVIVNLLNQTIEHTYIWTNALKVQWSVSILTIDVDFGLNFLLKRQKLNKKGIQSLT